MLSVVSENTKLFTTEYTENTEVFLRALGALGGEMTQKGIGIEQSLPETIPEDRLQAAREKLRLQGIEIEWITFSGTGGGGAGPQIKQKPPQMTDLEALQRFYEALGYVFPATWTFNVQIQP